MKVGNDDREKSCNHDENNFNEENKLSETQKIIATSQERAVAVKTCLKPTLTDLEDMAGTKISEILMAIFND